MKQTYLENDFDISDRTYMKQTHLENDLDISE
jgi:hypothetical protein